MFCHRNCVFVSLINDLKGTRMLNEGWNIIQRAAQNYFSNGYFGIVFIIAVICTLMNQKKNVFFLGIYILCSAVLLSNPLVAILLSKLGMDGVYWRCFWLLPIGGVIAYGVTRLASLSNKKIIRMIIVGLSVIAIAKSGSFIYNTWNFQKAENPYKISDEVIAVSNHIETGNTVLAPLEMLCWLRTYNSEIYLPIGRQEIYFHEPNEKHRVVELLGNDEVLDVDYIGEYAVNLSFKYIVYRKDKIVEGDWEDYGYYPVGETMYHSIYRR